MRTRSPITYVRVGPIPHCKTCGKQMDYRVRPSIQKAMSGKSKKTTNRP